MKVRGLVTLDESKLDNVVGGLGSPPNAPNTGLGFGPLVGGFLNVITGTKSNQPHLPGVFGLGNLFGFL
jgi:hypothetical protein